MAIEVKYTVLYRGAYIAQDGSIFSNKSADIAEFETEETALLFIDNNLPAGEYTISKFINKPAE